ncbi:uncharacterized protein ARMOST_11696 [Armillaria ostoyae]|uniref:Reverse transcriptase Ty1/copia-type domain-containing protein n=1 Tax=Armillaria ostoyae TaxID=47428 RepID=A0A284RHW2_ARMOS|nr:uncharacterized protein ARMOST_11696 [Armillaria ostoyae]
MLYPDCDLWQVVISAEHKNLIDQGMIKESDLPKGKCAIVAQGFSQQPDDYSDMYTLVAKIVSIRLILTYAAKEDLELYTFDVKATFLNAPLSQKALYSLKQSFYEWYKTLSATLSDLSLEYYIIDPAVFYGKWSSPPNPSISMPSNGVDLFILMPVHVDDGLTVTNSAALYHWLIIELNKRFKDHPSWKLKLSQTDYIEKLLQSYNMADVNPSTVPLCSKLHNLKTYPSQLSEVLKNQLIHYH